MKRLRKCNCKLNPSWDKSLFKNHGRGFQHYGVYLSIYLRAVGWTFLFLDICFVIKFSFSLIDSSVVPAVWLSIQIMFKL